MRSVGGSTPPPGSNGFLVKLGNSLRFCTGWAGVVHTPLIPHGACALQGAMGMRTITQWCCMRHAMPLYISAAPVLRSAGGSTPLCIALPGAAATACTPPSLPLLGVSSPLSEIGTRNLSPSERWEGLPRQPPTALGPASLPSLKSSLRHSPLPGPQLLYSVLFLMGGSCPRFIQETPGRLSADFLSKGFLAPCFIQTWGLGGSWPTFPLGRGDKSPAVNSKKHLRGARPPSASSRKGITKGAPSPLRPSDGTRNL